MKNEIWKSIPGYDGMYEVSSLGRVRSWKRGSRWGKSRSTPKILKYGMSTECKNPGGYRMNVLCKDGENKTCKVHRLVAKAFVPNPDNKKCVNHIDGNKENNEVSNLEWVTKGENNKHAFDTGLSSMDHLTGEKHPNSKLTKDDVRAIRILYKRGNHTYRSLGKKYGVDKALIGRIIKKSIWKTA